MIQMDMLYIFVLILLTKSINIPMYKSYIIFDTYD